MAKNTVPDKNTGDLLFAAEINDLASTQNTNDDLITTAQSTADGAATAASNAQTTADTANNSIGLLYKEGATLSNSVLVDAKNTRFAKVQGGDWNLTLDPASVNPAFAEIIIDQPDSLVIDSNWLPEGESQPAFDLTKEIKIILNINGNRVYYVVSQNPPNTDIVGPIVQGNAVVQNANPADFIVSYNEPVNVVNLTGITFTGDMAGLTPQSFSLSGDRRTLTITADGDVQTGETGTVVFASNNTITDDSGNPMLADTVNVTNNVGGDVTAPTVFTATIDASGTSLSVLFSEPVTGDNTDLSLDSGLSAYTLGSPSGSGTNTLVFPISGGPVISGEAGNFVYGASNTITDGTNGLVAGSTAVTNNSTRALPTQALEFDAAGDFLVTNVAPTLNTGSISGIAYVKSIPSQTLQFDIISTRENAGGAGTNNEYGLAFRTSGNGEPYIALHSEDGSAANRLAIRGTTGTELRNGTWVGIGFTYDGSGTEAGLKLFTNGSKVTSFESLSQGTFVEIANNPLSVMTWGPTQGEGFVSQVVLYKTELSESQMNEATNISSPVLLDKYGTAEYYISGSTTEETGNYTNTVNGTIDSVTDAP